MKTKELLMWILVFVFHACANTSNNEYGKFFYTLVGLIAIFHVNGYSSFGWFKKFYEKD